MVEQLQDPQALQMVPKELLVVIIWALLQAGNRLPSTSSSWTFAGIW